MEKRTVLEKEKYQPSYDTTILSEVSLLSWLVVIDLFPAHFCKVVRQGFKWRKKCQLSFVFGLTFAFDEPLDLQSCVSLAFAQVWGIHF